MISIGAGSAGVGGGNSFGSLAAENTRKYGTRKG
jgi:hypothetical protein